LAQDFWRHSGFHLLERDADGRLRVGDDFLRAYYLRPELRPVAESCAEETALHQTLMRAPRTPVDPARIEAIADADARANYRVMLEFRARLLAAPTLEACYLGLFAGGDNNLPPLFIDQLAQIILRNILDGVDDALELRAAELFYREQKASVQQGALMLADLETVELHAAGGGNGRAHEGLAQLIAESQTPMEPVVLDVLDSGNAELYWSRDERHDLVISLNQGRAALAALCRVLERWILHFTGARVNVTPVARIDEAHWAWHIGLDARSTALLNDLWQGAEPAPQRLAQLLALFRLDFADAAQMRADLAGRPVYLALSMDEEGVVRMKPQNLLLNLPLARAA
jgi:hypothetical protein